MYNIAIIAPFTYLLHAISLVDLMRVSDLLTLVFCKSDPFSSTHARNLIGNQILMIFIIVITNNNIPRGRFARMLAVDGKQGTVGSQIYAINLFMRNAIFRFFAKIKFTD